MGHQNPSHDFAVDVLHASDLAAEEGFWNEYRNVCELAIAGETAAARERLVRLSSLRLSGRCRTLIKNDVAVLWALEGRFEEAESALAAAVSESDACPAARANLALLRAGRPAANPSRTHGSTDTWIPPGASEQRIRVAIISFLFNWPSTSGGIIHTMELARFLGLAGYEVQHFYARHLPWNIGCVTEALSIDSYAVEFQTWDWHVAAIQQRFREVIGKFDPDYVIITDSWNFKPLLAQAVQEYPYILRQQALECVCPLNNLRLLVEADGSARQCAGDQLSCPDECRRCLANNGHQAGDLHRAERALAGVGSADYARSLRMALRNATAVLVLNPLVQTLLAPHADDVRVVTWGMDAARFPWPWPDDNRRRTDKTTLLMAGVVEEFIKGFHVLDAACRQLWQRRHDFELLVTADPIGSRNAFTRNIGWTSQQDLPRQLRAADIVVMPTVAQEGLARSSVEAMAVGRPVIASRIGGLPYTVEDETTGLLCEPGNPADLAAKIERLLDSPDQRERMGRLGRQRFEERFRWEVVIERDYRPLLNQRRVRS